MESVLVTSTGNIEGYKIIKYRKLVTTSVVLGTSMISDFMASITDFTGGRSETYQNKLQEMYQTAIAQLKNEARKTGANCIIGTTIDLDEISGKGMQMFMLNAVGTAVDIISNEDFEKEKDRILLLRKQDEEKEKAEQEKNKNLEERLKSLTTIDGLLEVDEIRNEANTIKRLYGEDRYNHFLKTKAREYGIKSEEE